MASPFVFLWHTCKSKSIGSAARCGLSQALRSLHDFGYTAGSLVLSIGMTSSEGSFARS